MWPHARHTSFSKVFIKLPNTPTSATTFSLMTALPASWRAPPLRIALAAPPHFTPGRRRGAIVRPSASGGRSRPSDAVSAGSAAEEVNGRSEVSVEGMKVGKSRLLRRRRLWRRILFSSRKIRSVVLLNVLTVIYASNIPVIKEIEKIVDPALFNMVRFVLSAIPFFPFIYQNQGDHQIRSHGIELGCWVSLGYLAQALGLLTSEAGRASFLSAFTVIVVPLMDGIFGATVPALTWVGATLSLIGVAMLESSGSPPSVGDFLNLLSAVFFGIHIFRTEHISRVTEKKKVFTLLGYEVGVVALFSAIWYFSGCVFGDILIGSRVSRKWAAAWDSIIRFPWIPALYTGLFSAGLCLWAEMSAMCNVSATETAIIYGLEPLWGASFAWFLLGERWSTTGWLGAALLLGGSLTVQIFGSAPKKQEQVHGSIKENEIPNDLSLSTVIISPGKNTRNLVKKHDKL